MSWAPAGTTLIARLAASSVFEVALVRHPDGRELISKRARAAVGSRGTEALSRESEILGAARAPCLPERIGTGSDASGPYLLQTRARGVALRDGGGTAPGGQLEAPAFMALAHSATAALAELHTVADARGALGIVHGDISPENVFYAVDVHQTTFVDLSSATWRDGREPIFQQDRGTLPYAAPELARGDARADQTTDTYALAAVLLWLATGRICEANSEPSRLLEIGTRGVLRERIHERQDLPACARTALLWALAFNPASRLRSSRELADAFISHVAGVRCSP